jgi:hypothetical protein
MSKARKKALLFLSIIILLLAQSLQLTFNAFEGWGGPTQRKGKHHSSVIYPQSTPLRIKVILK